MLASLQGAKDVNVLDNSLADQCDYKTSATKVTPQSFVISELLGRDACHEPIPISDPCFQTLRTLCHDLASIRPLQPQGGWAVGAIPQGCQQEGRTLLAEGDRGLQSIHSDASRASRGNRL